MRIKQLVKKLLLRLRGELPLEQYIKRGMTVGENFRYQNGCSFDISHCWLIQIGNDVQFSSRVHLLAHDASTQYQTGYVKIGKVVIGDGVFIGAGGTILPGVHIGRESVIGAGAVVKKYTSQRSLGGGVPARRICSIEEFAAEKWSTDKFTLFDESYTVRGGITEAKKKEMIDIVEKEGYAMVK